MAIPNTFSSGVNTSFSSELNENFDYLYKEGPQSTQTAYNSGTLLSATSTSYITEDTLTTPVARKDNQQVLVEAWVSHTNGNADQYIQLYDNTSSASIDEGYDHTGSNYEYKTMFLQGIITISTAGNTKTVALQQKTTNSSYNVIINSYYIKCTLL